MNTFIMYLQCSTGEEEIHNVISFQGEDISGRFGLLANHQRMATSLIFGICHFCAADRALEYLALPGGALYFNNNQLFISTNFYIRSSDYHSVENALDQELRIKEKSISSIKESLYRLDEEIFKRLLELGRQRL